MFNLFIGIFDFGIGGFLVVCVIIDLFFFEFFFYFGDIVCIFYGIKFVNIICQYSLDIICYLIELGVKVIVVVCNIVFVVVLGILWVVWLDIFIVGMELAVKFGVNVMQIGVVGVFVIVGIFKSQCYVDFM